jgi:hypothetical protein
MKAIPLTRGARAYVDDKDYDRLVTIGSWCLSFYGYAIHYRIHNGRRQVILMHRVIMSAPPHLQVDHINRNKVDNQRENLRFATRSQNQANKGIQKNNTSHYKGVVWNRGKWVVRIRYQGARLYLGRYADPIIAAQVYDGMSRELNREFAGCNFPDQATPEPIRDIVLTYLTQFQNKAA